MTPLDPDTTRELDRLERRTAEELGRIERRVLAVEVMPIRLGVIESELAGIKEDIADLRRRFEDRARERERERKDAAKVAEEERREQLKQQRAEARNRKLDRVLYIGTAIAAVGASGWIVSLLNGPT